MDASLKKYMSGMSKDEKLNHLEKIKDWKPETYMYEKVRVTMMRTAERVLNEV